MKTAPDPARTGSLLGRYRLIELIGSGGMGEVYRAVDTALDREVAVKILPPEAVATPDNRRRFETEAKSAATVSHPNLVPVYDVGESDGTPFIVQELVKGSTVSHILDERGSLPIERVAEWGAQAADGLAHAHEAGILHRDVKPGNLMIGQDGRLRVLDFGLAKMVSGARPRLSVDPLTRDGFVVGTVHYMSPEQALGREVDARSDAFSLGIVLYEMATGRRPFDAESAIGTMHAIAYDPPRPFAPADPRLPEGFLAILDKVLEKRPEDRYQTLADLAVDLRRFLKRTSGSNLAAVVASRGAEPTLEIATAGKPRVRRFRMALACGAAAAVLGAGWWIRASRISSPAALSTTRFIVQTDSREEGAVFSPDGHGFAYASNAHGDYDIYYRLLSGGSPVRLTDSQDDERQPAFTPDGASILFTRGDLAGGSASVWSVPALGGPVRRVLDSGDEPVVFHDGKRLLSRRFGAGRTSLWETSIDGSAPRKIFDAERGELTGARLSSDDLWIAFFWRESYPGALGDVWKVSASGGKPIRLTTDRRDVWGNVAWAADDSTILFGSARSGAPTIWAVAAKGGALRPAVSASGWAVSPSLSPDGRSMLAQTRRAISDAWDYSLPAGEARALTNSGSIWAPTQLPDGRLLYGDWARQEEEIDLYVEDASGSRSLVGRGSNPRASADGKHFFFSSALGGGRRGLFTAELEGGPSRRLTDPPGSDEYPDAAGDGSFLVFCRTEASGESALMTLSLKDPHAAPKRLFAGDALSSRAGASAAVLRSCTPAPGCGVYAVPYDGGRPLLLVPDGRWPALSPDRETVYAVVGPKSKPSLVRVPLDGSRAPAALFEFNAGRDPQFWAVFTLDVTADHRHVIATHQKNDDDIVLIEGLLP
ncbi:MAG: protein kinase [Thermoanaerobaculia bacterium]